MKDADARARITFEEDGRAAIATLDCPERLNALSLDMIAALEAHHLRHAKHPRTYGVLLRANGRAFCAGGDLRALHELKRAGEMDALLAYYRAEYQHCWTLQSFTKPNVALIDGAALGGGVGICLYGTHRVAGENFSLAMPETGIGFFPDIGASYFLARMPDSVGVYLGLTGAAIGRGDAYRLGLATHCIDAADFAAIRRALAEGEPIDPFLDALHRDPGPGSLAALQPVIGRIFSAPSIEEIFERLDAETGAHAAWAGDTARLLSARSALSLKVTLRLLQAGAAAPTLKDALKLEFRAAARFLEGDEFFEGIRAAIIDKDKAPRWAFETAAEIPDQAIETFLTPVWEGELELRDHWTLVD